MGLGARKRGPKRKGEDPRFVKLQQENARLERKLKQADLIISFQKKVAEILGIPLKTLADDGTES